VARPQGVEVLGIAGPDETLWSPWPPLATRPCSTLVLQEVRECDTKMQVLHVLSFVVERVGPAVRPHAPALVQYLPHLWEEARDYNMLRAAILSTLVVLVQVRLWKVLHDDDAGC
jgi:hypothetical protein